MSDYKFLHPTMARRYSYAPDYPEVVPRELGTDTYVNVIPQYHRRVRSAMLNIRKINRCLTHREFRQAIQAAREAGLFRLDVRSAWQANIVGD
jgi:uncharacterized Fe-S radical SAM superfamily protein PflX